MGPFSAPRPVVVGHRGAPSVAPENTPAAFAAAAAAGAEWVELDVRRSADQVLMVHHDPCTPDDVPLCAQSADELTALGVWRFDDVLARLPPGLGVDIEVKNLVGEPDYDEDNEIVGLVTAALEGRENERPWLVSSFNPLTVSELATALPELAVGLVHASLLQLARAALFAVELGATVVCPHRETPDLDADGVAAAHAAGVAVMPWTVNELAEARRLATAGVDAICTDDPAAVVAALRPPD